MKTFVFERGGQGWWELRGNYVYNMCGGRHIYDPDDCETIVEAESWEDLDWDCLLDPDSDLGWLSPKGDWYPCGYQDHSIVADFCLKSSEEELEEQGWVKIYFLSWSSRKDIDYYCKNRITKAQRDWLLEHGYELKRGDEE